MMNRLAARTWVFGLVLTLTFFFVSGAQAVPLAGTVLTPPGATVFPGATNDSPGTLLASMVTPWSFLVPPPNGGTTSGELRSAVFMNTTGTLDFYYQIVNNAGSSTNIARESNANFSAFTTS